MAVKTFGRRFVLPEQALAEQRAVDRARALEGLDETLLARVRKLRARLEPHQEEPSYREYSDKNRRLWFEPVEPEAINRVSDVLGAPAPADWRAILVEIGCGFGPALGLDAPARLLDDGLVPVPAFGGEGATVRALPVVDHGCGTWDVVLLEGPDEGAVFLAEEGRLAASHRARSLIAYLEAWSTVALQT